MVSLPKKLCALFFLLGIGCDAFKFPRRGLGRPTASSQGQTKKNKTMWTPLEEQLDAWVLTQNFGVVVGNASGIQFEYVHGNFSLHEVVETASTSKWPIAMMLAGLVDDGTIKSLDSFASDYVPWWSSDRANEAKANITIRQLLSFTSGFDDGEQAGGGSDNSTTCMDNYTSPLGFDGCAKQIYASTNLSGTPGLSWAYNSVHLQMAGAVAIHASKLDIQSVVKKYLFDPYGMNRTTCGNGLPNPQLAVCLQTTGSDYQKFLQAQLTNSVLSERMVVESELDHTPWNRESPQFYGLYGFGHFLECFDSQDGFTPACEAAMTHCDPGAFGFYPLIDRANGYYMEIVAYETNEYYPRSGIPEYLRLLVKPMVDAILREDGRRRDDKAVGRLLSHHTPQFNALTMVDVNYITGCFINPDTCE